MDRARRKNDFLIPALYVLIDALAIEAAFVLSYLLRFDTRVFAFLPLNEAVPSFSAYLLSSLVVIPIWLLIFEYEGMYGSRRRVSVTDELFAAVKYVTLGMLVVMSVAFFYREFSYSRVMFVILWGVAISTVFVGRVVSRQMEKAIYKSGKEIRNAVIIGWDGVARRLADSIRSNHLPGYNLVGYFAEGSAAADTTAEHLGTLSDVRDAIVSRNIELALIALDHSKHKQLFDLVRDCEGINVEFLMVPDVLDLLTSRMVLSEIEGIPLIKIKGLPMSTWGRVLKRTFDLVVVLVMTIVLLPVMILVAIIVKLDSPGPVFYSQERMGEDGRLFKILKFRSMRIDAEANGPVWSSGVRETRHTNSGKWLRMTSLDELPQLLNVVKGEMSLVGPRPERPFFVEQFKTQIPKYLERHRVKAGVTGWAQVNGLRGDSDLEERTKYDIFYVENWSLGFDIKIIFRTISEIGNEVLRHLRK